MVKVNGVGIACWIFVPFENMPQLHNDHLQDDMQMLSDARMLHSSRGEIYSELFIVLLWQNEFQASL